MTPLQVVMTLVWFGIFVGVLGWAITSGIDRFARWLDADKPLVHCPVCLKRDVVRHNHDL